MNEREKRNSVSIIYCHRRCLVSPHSFFILLSHNVALVLCQLLKTTLDVKQKRQVRSISFYWHCQMSSFTSFISFHFYFCHFVVFDHKVNSYLVGLVGGVSHLSNQISLSNYQWATFTTFVHDKINTRKHIVIIVDRNNYYIITLLLYYIN